MKEYLHHTPRLDQHTLPQVDTEPDHIPLHVIDSDTQAHKSRPSILIFITWVMHIRYGLLYSN